MRAEGITAGETAFMKIIQKVPQTSGRFPPRRYAGVALVNHLACTASTLTDIDAGDKFSPVFFDSLIQHLSRLALRSLSRASQETDAPEFWYSSNSWALSSEVY
jgi:hypothetical protein